MLLLLPIQTVFSFSVIFLPPMKFLALPFPDSTPPHFSLFHFTLILHCAPRYKVVVLVVSTIFGTFVWDRLCTMMFAPKVFKAMTVEASRTTLNDVKPVRPLTPLFASLLNSSILFFPVLFSSFLLYSSHSLFLSSSLLFTFYSFLSLVAVYTPTLCLLSST